MMFSIICPLYCHVENTTLWHEREYCEMQFRQEILFKLFDIFSDMEETLQLRHI